MVANGIDPTSVSGKAPTVDETTDLLVIGAGPAGCAAAIEGAHRGLSVVLVDENPVEVETMNEHVPLSFGGRMTGAVRNRTAMTEAVLAASSPVTEAFEAGVDVRLGTACWGLFVAAPTAAWVRRPVAGLVDADGVRHVGFGNAIVATGSRDMGLAFPGWDLPGVMGAVAARRLATLYGALDARRAVVIGSGAEALLTALDLVAAGVSVVAVVEAAEGPVGPATLVERIGGQGIEMLTGHVVARAIGGAVADGVAGVVVVALAPDGTRIAGSERTLDCDTLVQGIAAVPVIDLLESAGCRTVFDPARGGHVPILDAGGKTTVAGIYAIGDAAGVWDAKSIDPEVAIAEARRSVAAIMGFAPEHAEAPPRPAVDLDGALKRWVRATVIDAEGSPHVCQCEEVTARDVLEVRPPRYLGWEASTQKPADLRTMLGNGPPSPDQVKRLTRAGMGTCQGRRCREQVAVLLALEAGVPLSEVPLASYRPPVRPLRLDQMTDHREQPEMTEHWQGWFGIDTMWLAPWELGADGRPLEADND
jgi:thioredoxin reductase